MPRSAPPPDRPDAGLARVGLRRRLTPAERGAIVGEHASGASPSALASRFRVSRQTIHAVVRGARAAQAVVGTRSRVVSTRVSAAELLAFDAAVAGTGLTRSEAVARLVRGAAGFFVPEGGEAEALRRATAALDRAGGNVNQIARALNEACLRGLAPPYTGRSDAELREFAQVVFALADQVQDVARGRQAQLGAAAALEGAGHAAF